MERNTLTTVFLLKPGDRFYKAKDKSKKVFEIVEHAPKATKYKTYAYWCCSAVLVGSRFEDKNTVAIDAKTEVVFLRSTN